MSTALPTALPGRPQRLRWTGDDFDRAVEMGLFDGRRVELIDGDILEMPPMNDPHAYAVQLGTYLLIRLFPPEKFTVRVQLPLRLGDSRPLPDFAIILGSPVIVEKHPTSALLIIEVSDTTLEFDQIEKSKLYATHGIPEYWIVDLNSKRVEVRRNPVAADGGEADYADRSIAMLDQTLAPVAAPDIFVNVRELIPWH